MIRRSRFPVLFAVTIGLFLLAGCGSGKGTQVSGKLLVPKDMKLEKDDQVEINFVPESASSGAASATVNVADMTFVATSNVMKVGIPPGKYKVTIHVTPYLGNPGSAKRNQTLNETVNKNYDVSTTRLTFEVPQSDQPVNVTVDLIKGAVTKD